MGTCCWQIDLSAPPLDDEAALLLMNKLGVKNLSFEQASADVFLLLLLKSSQLAGITFFHFGVIRLRHFFNSKNVDTTAVFFRCRGWVDWWSCVAAVGSKSSWWWWWWWLDTRRRNDTYQVTLSFFHPSDEIVQEIATE
jgi:hypothetical protein